MSIGTYSRSKGGARFDADPHLHPSADFPRHMEAEASCVNADSLHFGKTGGKRPGRFRAPVGGKQPFVNLMGQGLNWPISVAYGPASTASGRVAAAWFATGPVTSGHDCISIDFAHTRAIVGCIEVCVGLAIAGRGKVNDIRNYDGSLVPDASIRRRPHDLRSAAFLGQFGGGGFADRAGHRKSHDLTILARRGPFTRTADGPILFS